MDTVFAADHPFQTLKWLEDGVLNGPGTADMKAGISVILAALSALEARMVARVPPMLQIAQERLADRTAEPVPRRAGRGALAAMTGRQGAPALALSPPA